MNCLCVKTGMLVIQKVEKESQACTCDHVTILKYKLGIKDNATSYVL